MTTTLKLRVDHADAQHVHLTMFAGRYGALQNCGHLCMSPEDYRLLRTTLEHGAGHMTDSLALELPA